MGQNIDKIKSKLLYKFASKYESESNQIPSANKEIYQILIHIFRHLTKQQINFKSEKERHLIFIKLKTYVLLYSQILIMLSRTIKHFLCLV